MGGSVRQRASMVSGYTPIEPEGLFHGLRWQPIAYGIVVDTFLTLITFVPLYLWFAGPDFFSENEAVANKAVMRAYGSTLFNFVGLVVGGLCTAVGAFVAARRAGVHFVRHGGWVAVGSAVLAVVLLALVPAGPSQPIWVELVGFIMIIPCGVLGGHIAGQIEASAA